MPRLFICVLFASLVAGSRVPATEQRAPLKVLISVDMEGVAGAVPGEQLGPSGFEYGRFREFTTREALAAVEGAKAAGATDIVVVDAHGNGQNLLIDQFPPDARIIRSPLRGRSAPRETSGQAEGSPAAQLARRNRTSLTVFRTWFLRHRANRACQGDTIT